jgi:cyclophilin family peptidyl-prolyl cis-trans isomerase
MLGKRSPVGRWIVTMSLFGFLTAICSPAVGQISEELATSNDEQADSLLAKYENKKAEYDANAKKINDSYRNLKLGSREERAEQKELVNDLRLQQKQVQLEIFQAAFEVVRSEEEVNEELLRDATTYAQASFEGSKYNIQVSPAKSLEICNALNKRGVPARQTLQLAVNSALAILDFETAKAKVNEAAEEGLKIPPQLIERVTAAEKNWLREKELRTTDRDMPTVRIETSAGDITIELFEDAAPESVKNFIHLIDSDFYSGLKFFAANRGQLIRTGCPKNTGRRSAEFTIKSEAGLDTARGHFRGSVSLMSVNNYEICSSQFVICQRPLPHLDGKFTVFGQVTDGMRVLDQLVSSVVEADSDLENKPSIELIQVTFRRPNTTYVPEKIEK